MAYYGSNDEIFTPVGTPTSGSFGSELRPTDSPTPDNFTTGFQSPLSRNVSFNTSDEKPSKQLPTNSNELFNALGNYVIYSDPKNKSITYGKRGILFFCSTTCMWLYVEPSLEYSQEHKLSLAETILTVSCNTLPSAFVMWNVAKSYLNFLEKRHYLEIRLQQFLDQKKLQREKRDTAAIFFFATASALPLSIPVFQTSGELSLPWQIVKALIMQLDYTFNHAPAVSFPSVLFILELPFKIILSPLEINRRCALSSIEIFRELLEQQKKEDIKKIKQRYVDSYNKTMGIILGSCIEFDPKKLSFKISFPSEVHQALQKPELLTQHLALLDSANNLIKAIPADPPPSRLRRCYNVFCRPMLRITHEVLRKITRAAGSVLMASGVTGFMMAVFNESRDLTQSDDAAWAIASLPTFVTLALTGYYGGLLAQGVYDFIVSCLGGKIEVPLAMKLYPKTALCLYAIASLLSFYSPQTAMLLVEKNFADPEYDAIRDTLIECTRFGVTGFTFINLLQIINSGLLLFAKKFGDDDTKMAAQLANRSNRLSMAVFALDDDQFLEALNPLHDEILTPLLGCNKIELAKQTDSLTNLRTKLVDNGCVPKGYWQTASYFLSPKRLLAEIPESSASAASVSPILIY